MTICARFAAVAAGMIVGSSIAYAAAPAPLSNRSCGPDATCQKILAKVEDANRRAWKGDYTGQREVAQCLTTGCLGFVVVDPTLACAWRMVILASGSAKTDRTDLDLLRAVCSGLAADDLILAHTKAAAVFKAIYRRDMPAATL